MCQFMFCVAFDSLSMDFGEMAVTIILLPGAVVRMP